MEADQRKAGAIEGDMGIMSIMTQKPQVRVGDIHVPIARDLTIHTVNDRWERSLYVSQRISSASPPIGASDDINRKLWWEDRCHAFALWDCVWCTNNNAWIWCCVFVIVVTPVCTCDTVTWTTCDIEQLFVVGVAPTSKFTSRGRLHLPYSEIIDATNMALLACDALCVCLLDCFISCISCVGRRQLRAVCERQLWDFDSQLDQLSLCLCRQVVHKPHHYTMAQTIPQDLVKVITIIYKAVETLEICFHFSRTSVNLSS